MKVFLFVFVLVGAVAVALSADEYTNKYDNIDVDEILSNERLYKKYIDCILSKGKCTPDGQELKDNIPDALQTECAKCNAVQKKRTEHVIKFLIENKKDDFEELSAKFDPEGVYRKKYEEQKKLLEQGKSVIS